MTVQVGDDELEAPPGTYACVPPGVLHTFANRSEQPVRFLNLNTPGGWEDYICDLAAVMPADGPPDPRVLGEVFARYDVVVPLELQALCLNHRPLDSSRKTTTFRPVSSMASK